MTTTIESIPRFPLHWPINWARTRSRQRANEHATNWQIDY